MGLSMAKVERILVVGGGIAGLTAAIALRQRGFSPELIEREPEWRAAGAGIALQPNAMRVLRSLGVGMAVERAGAPLQRFKYCTSQGEVLAEIDLVELWKDVGRGAGVERTKLQEALLGALKGAMPSGLVDHDARAEERLRFGSLQRRAKGGLRSDRWRRRNPFERPFILDERPGPYLYRADGVAQLGAGPSWHPGRSAVLARRRMLFWAFPGQQ
jgi:glycine/D-amino acid oxidase-like deaminating enzyme